MEYEIKPLASAEEETIAEKVGAWADTMAPSEPATKEEQLIFRATDEEGRVIAGCVINIHAWGRAVLAQLWADERHRGQGLGSMLIRAAERAAREKGCYYMCLGTTDFHARPLYEKHGYRVFTVNRDVPRGHESWSLCKRLDLGIPDYVPKNNSAAARYRIEPGTEEDAAVVDAGLDRHGAAFVQDGHDPIPLGRKLVDRNGRLIAGIAADLNGDDVGEIDAVWVEEPYRNRGLGSALLAEVERTARENGAYILLTNACDWNVDFFRRNGYTVRGELADYPRGHCAYELEKRL